jgi:hypothetical protein
MDKAEMAGRSDNSVFLSAPIKFSVPGLVENLFSLGDDLSCDSDQVSKSKVREDFYSSNSSPEDTLHLLGYRWKSWSASNPKDSHPVSIILGPSPRCSVCKDLSATPAIPWPDLAARGYFQFIKTTISALRRSTSKGCQGCELIFGAVVLYDRTMREEIQQDAIDELHAIKAGQDVEEYLAKKHGVEMRKHHRLSWSSCHVYVSGFLGNAVMVAWERIKNYINIRPIEIYMRGDSGK